MFHARHFENRREDVLVDDRRIEARSFRRLSRPAEYQRHADAAFVDGSFTLAQRQVLRVGLSALVLSQAVTAVVRHEEDDRVVGDPFGFEVVEYVAQAFVHSLDHRGVTGLLFVHSRVEVFSDEPFVALNGCVVGVVGEIEVEGLFAADRVFQCFQRFERQRLGQMDSRAVILRHVLHRGVGTSFGEVAEVFFGQITLGVAVARTGDVDRESHVVGVRARCAGRCPVRFADVDGVVACVAENLHHRRGVERAVQAVGDAVGLVAEGGGAQRVVVPFGVREDIVFVGVRRAGPAADRVGAGVFI